ncbi:hypothetical protein HELRODRAFT_73524 [Helobdella robusta]|uniref:Metallo-beta-lactamase domain-containing protein n=1 Tax=Helobdella robusta TaxID=6412 RepID=T1G1F2_HELRO|nr:hypothetical protein HELRODRAFT_73524 [Helobdella robusta]ESO09559.1 hypothetical protein HELRODRAFT_73524 [Helobdella robusta]
MSVSLSFIPALEQLSTRVIRILGCNPGPFTLQGTNTYLIGTGNKRILLDTGESNNANYLENLVSILKQHNSTIKEVIITHWHGDHIGGVPAVFNRFNDSSLKINKFKRLSKPDEKLENNIPINYLENNSVLSVDGATLKTIYTPGHTDDHMSVLLHEENALFTGDCVLGEGTCVFEDLHSYMNSLELIKSLNPSVIYPGHGAVVRDPQQHVSAYIANRNNREQQIVNALSDYAEKTPMQIVEIVYKTTPRHLFPAAEGNVIHHLNKLLKDNLVGM